MINDNIECETDIKVIKCEMFFAFASGHIVELLTRCGTVLTEDVLYAIFNFTITDRHLSLLHRGIVLRNSIVLIHNSYNKNSGYTSNRIIFTLNQHQIRIAQKTALQLLCTYFKGLDSIVKISSSRIHTLPTSYISINNIIEETTAIQQNVNYRLLIGNEINLIEYPLQLGVSCMDAITNSTYILYSLQQVVCNNRYIGAANILLNQQSLNINFNAEITSNELGILCYFTGFDCVTDFKEWVDDLLEFPIDDMLVRELLKHETETLLIYNIIFTILAIPIIRRDNIIMGFEPHEFIEISAKEQLLSHIPPSLFTILHEYAQMVSAPTEFNYRNTVVAKDIKTIVSVMYNDIIPKRCFID